MSDGNTLLYIGVIGLGLLVAAATAHAMAADAAPMPSDDMPDQVTSTFEDIAVAMSPSTYYSGGDAMAMESNLSAFLDMIAYAEGTSGPDGYRAMFGYPLPGRLIQSFADHPRQHFSFTNSIGQTLRTNAAGRYQFMIRTWDDLRAKLGLPDFSPASQDAAAIELIRQRGALNDVRAGRVEDAIAKCAPIWASLPGAGYNQPERKLTSLISNYQNAGGQLA